MPKMKNKRLFFILIFYLINFLLGQEGARYLIITHDNFYSILQPLAEWKHKKGMMTKVTRLSEIGSTPASIRNYVIQAYNNWNPRPEFLLLVGAPSLLPSYYNPTLHIYTDNYYANVTGDYRAEIPYGRLPCKTARQCSVMINKILSYEKRPTLQDSFWLVKGVGIVNEDGSSDDTIYWNNVRFACQLMGQAGFIQVDTFSRLRGHNASHVINAINDGRSIVLYRGQGVGNWYSPFRVDVNLTNNGPRLPVIASITCQTLTLAPNESMVGEAWLKVGAPDALRGAVAFFGNTNSATGVAPIRGACTRGFFRAYFSLSQLGKACLAGKESIYVRFGNQKDYEGFNLLGDPELNILTGIPKPLSVNHPSAVRPGNQNVTITVHREGVPVANALVCLLKGEEVYNYGYTNSSGEVSLIINPTTPGSILLTVTAKNSLPFEGTITCLPPSGPYLVYHRATYNDLPPRGNGNGVPNPGEEVWAKVALKNLGDVPAEGVSAVFTTTDPNCLVLDSIKNYGSILPDSIKENAGYYIFRLAQSIPDGYTIPFNLTARDNQGNVWQQTFSILIRAGRLTFVQSVVKDSEPGGNYDQKFDPGESGYLLLKIRNTGSDLLTDCQALLKTDETLLKIVDSLSFFGTLAPGEERFNSLTPFSLTISPSLWNGACARLKLLFSGSGGQYSFLDSTEMVLTIGGTNPAFPIGKDPYGYFIYDNTDIASGRAPTYNWIDIRSTGTVVPGATNANDTIVSLSLPFRFRYYGRDYDTISISSNGFLVFGRSTYRSGYNRPIPSQEAPIRGLFPFWDDLDTRPQQGVNGEVYHYYDAANNRYIILYHNCPHYGQPQIRETFEVILYDPRFYPTPSGDGEILFQYAVVSDATSCTVGFQDHTETQGVQYLFDTVYDPNAAILSANRAIKITTQPPVVQDLPWLTLERLSIDDTQGGNGNGLLEPGEFVHLVVYLKNRGTAAVSNLLGRLRARDQDFLVNDSLFNFGTVAIGQEVDNSSSPYSFTISLTPADSVLSFLLYLSGTGYTNALFFSLGMGSFTALSSSNFAYPQAQPLPTIMRLNDFNSLLVKLTSPSGQKPSKPIRIYNSFGRQISFVGGGFNLSSGVYFIHQDKKIVKICLIR